MSRKLKEIGVTIINRQNQIRFNENIFDTIDTEKKAYWLGFIYADGYIDSTPLEENKKSTYKFEISLKASDAGHLHKFNEFMEHNKDNVKIGSVMCNKTKCFRCRWYVTNKHLWNTLNNYGCTHRKSLTLKFPDSNIFNEESLIRHFIRGYFDGDGCFSRTFYKDKVFPCCSFLGTYEFLKVIKDILTENDIHTPDIRKNDKNNVYVLHLS